MSNSSFYITILQRVCDGDVVRCRVLLGVPVKQENQEKDVHLKSEKQNHKGSGSVGLKYLQAEVR